MVITIFCKFESYKKIIITLQRYYAYICDIMKLKMILIFFNNISLSDFRILFNDFWLKKSCKIFYKSGLRLILVIFNLKR